MNLDLRYRNLLSKFFSLLVFMLFVNCSQPSKIKSDVNKSEPTRTKKKFSITVTATAYNSVERQTKKGNIGLAAWGDWLQPGEKAIAVSRDLIDLGLDHNEEIEIEGLEGIYIVKDKMNKRWRNKIDIYMGLDEKAALEWGKKQVTITFNPKDRPNDKFSTM